MSKEQDEQRPPALVDQLPDEILEAVFLLNTSKEFQNDCLIHDPHRTTIATVLVCKRWHNVALDYPALWSRIIDYERHPPQWVEELLRRSKSSPIDVGEDSVFKHVRLRNHGGKAMLGQIFEHASTIRTLSLQITYSPWDLICKKFLQYPAPLLEYLNLITSCPFPDCLYPGPLFALEAPRLRRLHLQRCLIDFSSPVLTNLTELSVLDILAPRIMSMRKPDHPLKVAPTVGGWLRILEHIPSLLYLTLSSAITHSSNEDDPMPDVHLPNLLFLTVGATFNDGTAFLHHLSIPATCGVRLRFSHNRSSPGLDGTKLLSFLSTRLSYWPDGSHDRYLQAKILSGDRVHFGNSRRVGYIWDMTESAVIQEHTLTSADPLIWLVLSFDSSDDTLIFFNQLLALYETTYSTTTMLELWVDEEFTTMATAPVNGLASAPSRNTLHSFFAVKNLNLLGRSPVYLLPIFQTASLPERPVFPALRSLRLTRTNFEDGQRSAYYTVIDFLIWRTKMHMPVTELQIIESKITKETEDSLSQIGNVKVTLGSLGSNLIAEDLSDQEDVG
ncbi:hypothetical protein GALMADRAFT_153283 [Galerina marginata CBS 339.88]|uniref:Uncharacterized protein n=1 Tax=Galerina marginata (strain CBS 339.88) TaxID=685588 RepID=A0A067TLU3_GALM3|nr:hypothetical protein GALMADRAFT_153283 [Galerina marginata CBS 339.88]